MKHFGIYTFKRCSYSSDAVVLRRSKLKRTIEFSRNSSNNRNTSHRNYSRESTNDWSMVDHMVCGVGGGVLLYSDLGYMVDLVVDLVTNMMDYRGSSNMDCWGSISNSGNWGSFQFHSVYLRNNWSCCIDTSY